MHITVLDDKKDRGEYHQSGLEKLQIKSFKILTAIDIESIQNLKSDIMLIHRNNKESNLIESSEHFGKKRIFFSDGLRTYHKEDKYNYYVAYVLLYERLDLIIKGSW